MYMFMFICKKIVKALPRRGTTSARLTMVDCAVLPEWKAGGTWCRSIRSLGWRTKVTARIREGLWWPLRRGRRWTASSSTWRTSSPSTATHSAGPLALPHHSDTKVRFIYRCKQFFSSHRSSKNALVCLYISPSVKS